MKLPLDATSLRRTLHRVETLLYLYKALLLFLVLALLYGFIALRITMLSSREPSAADLAKAEKTVTPKRIPESTAQRLKSLEGTNERTQSIFNEARQNPFKE